MFNLRYMILGVFSFGFISAGSAAFGHNDRVEEINRAIARSRGIHWEAKDNGTFEQFADRLEKSSPFGLASKMTEMSPMETFNENEQEPGRAPGAFDLRQVDGQNWVTPIRNQGKCGSCVAFAALAAFEGALKRQTSQAGLEVDLSEQYLFSDIGSCDSGSMVGIATRSMISKGVSDEACFRYTSGRSGVDLDVTKACSDRASRVYKLKSARAYYDAASIKSAIMKGPVITTMSVYEDFMFYSSGIYKHVTGEELGGHAVSIVGWNDSERYWIVRNSWGTSWGEAGYVRVSYDDTSGIASSATAVTIASSALAPSVKSPAQFDAVGGNSMEVKVDMPGAASPAGSVEMRRLGSLEVVQSKNLGNDAAAVLDVSSVQDGVYELKTTVSGQSGATSRPGYGLVVVSHNGVTQGAFSMAPDFDATAPIKDRVYFKIAYTGTGAPLTHAALVIESADGLVNKSVEVTDPGDFSMIGWRTGSMPNGLYKVYAKGRIGNLDSVVTDPLELTVAN
jgi:C1A family cysteine protease